MVAETSCFQSYCCSFINTILVIVIHKLRYTSTRFTRLHVLNTETFTVHIFTIHKHGHTVRGFTACLFGTIVFHIFTTVHKHIVRSEAVMVLTGTLQPCSLEKRYQSFRETCINVISPATIL